MTNKATFPPIHEETRELVGTPQAAYYLLRAEQTLRTWAMNGDGLVRPVRIGKRLGWPMAEIRRVCVPL